MESLDIDSLFTNISLAEAIDISINTSFWDNWKKIRFIKNRNEGCFNSSYKKNPILLLKESSTSKLMEVLCVAEALGNFQNGGHANTLFKIKNEKGKQNVLS